MVFLIGAVQFINIWDFVMVMPLGPDFATALGIPISRLGLVGGAYTAAAAVAGVAGSTFLDRFDRRPALAAAMTGLVLGTLAGGLAWNFESLLAARLLAGAFGGPATSLSLSIIADTVPPERRGKAMGAVMGAFSVASVIGVPLSLQLSLWGGWRLPFIVVGALGLAVTAGVAASLPTLRAHLARRAQGIVPVQRLFRPLVLTSYAMTATTMAAGFLVLPNISAYVQANLGLPRIQLQWVYGIGGVVSFVTLRVVGRLVDRFGSFRVGSVAALLLAAAFHLLFVDVPRGVPVTLLAILLFFALAARNVSYNTLCSKVPEPVERARFMSFQSAVQHVASALGAGLSSQVLFVQSDGSLGNVPTLGRMAIALTLLLPFLLHRVERGVRLGAGGNGNRPER
ncbi:MAG TPA: MFS transporter, partial [Myxococcaceae bacterium]|nr:MFS transporter [Myxococcaceae bacterium]